MKPGSMAGVDITWYPETLLEYMDNHELTCTGLQGDERTGIRIQCESKDRQCFVIDIAPNKLWKINIEVKHGYSQSQRKLPELQRQGMETSTVNNWLDIAHLLVRL